MSTAQGGREEADGLLERRVEAGNAIETRVAEQLGRSRPWVKNSRHNNRHTVLYSAKQQLIKVKKSMFILCADV